MTFGLVSWRRKDWLLRQSNQNALNSMATMSVVPMTSSLQVKANSTMRIVTSEMHLENFGRIFFKRNPHRI